MWRSGDGRAGAPAPGRAVRAHHRRSAGARVPHARHAQFALRGQRRTGPLPLRPAASADRLLPWLPILNDRIGLEFVWFPDFHVPVNGFSVRSCSSSSGI